MKNYSFRIFLVFIILSLVSCVPSNQKTASGLKFSPKAAKPIAPTATVTGSIEFKNFQNIMASKCISCHQTESIGDFSKHLTEMDWISSGLVNRGVAATSPLYLSLKGTDANGTMPKNLPALTGVEIKTISDWIASTRLPVVPTINSFTSTSLSINAGQSVTLSWSVSDAKTITISGIGDVTGTTSRIISPTTSGTYILTATSDAGVVTSALTINITILNAPTITSFTASSVLVASGASVTLSWVATNAATFSISGIGAVTGTSRVVNPTANTTYILTATNASGSVVRSVVINILPAPVIGAFTATPATIVERESTTLAWTVMNSTSLSIAGIGAVTGTTRVVSPTTTTTYTLTATGLGGTTTRNVTVTVTPYVAPPPPTSESRFAAFRTTMNNKCLGCHGSDLNGNFALLTTEAQWLNSKYVTAGDIHSSLIYTMLKGENVNGTMPEGLAVLTTAEINSIKDWITNAVAVASPFTGHTLKMGNRTYVNSVFRNVFGSSNTQEQIEVNNQITNYLPLSEKKILRNNAFQGPCDPYSLEVDGYVVAFADRYSRNPVGFQDDWCSKDDKLIDFNVPVRGQTNSVRHGILTQVCEGQVAHVPSLEYALRTHHGWVSGDLAVNAANLTIAYQNFYPEKPLPAAYMTALTEVANTTTINRDKWKWIYLTICLSASWQAP